MLSPSSLPLKEQVTKKVMKNLFTFLKILIQKGVVLGPLHTESFEWSWWRWARPLCSRAIWFFDKFFDSGASHRSHHGLIMYRQTASCTYNTPAICSSDVGLIEWETVCVFTYHTYIYTYTPSSHVDIIAAADQTGRRPIGLANFAGYRATHHTVL